MFRTEILQYMFTLFCRKVLLILWIRMWEIEKCLTESMGIC